MDSSTGSGWVLDVSSVTSSGMQHCCGFLWVLAHAWNPGIGLSMDPMTDSKFLLSSSMGFRMGSGL